jgi:methionyl-tRNA synthetase
MDTATMGLLASQLGMTVGAITATLVILLVWQSIWKGIAMWKAARNHHLVWFIVFLVVNLLAIPEILYLIFWSKPKKIKEVEEKAKKPLKKKRKK